MRRAVFSLFLFGLAIAQQVGTFTPERHPSLPTQECDASGCRTQSTSVVLDANWRWLHSVSGSENCYNGNTWSCGTSANCTANCAVEGADYSGTYGITSNGGALKLAFMNKHQYGTNVGSRVYLLENDNQYKMLKLMNREFTYDVDVSTLPCGLNAALYLVEMEKDGGKSRYPTNKAGAAYGTGYCDAQCPHDLKYISGEANADGWKGTSANSGAGQYGSCCHEMDIWEGNSISNAYTPHPCSKDGPYRCLGDEDCGSGDARYKGVCDKDGCDYNPYRMGDRSFYGKGKTIDTSKVFTVVTQFISTDGTDNGDLSEIRRYYIQNGKLYTNAATKVSGVTSTTSVSKNFCAQQKSVFGDPDAFAEKGGMKVMGEAVARGMALVLSIWDDYDVSMLWLDSNWPTTKDASTPGVARGECSIDSGKPADVERDASSAYVIYSNIKWGTINSTFTTSGKQPTTKAPTTKTPTTNNPPTTTSTTGGAPTVACSSTWGQCGGRQWTGATCCVAGTTCKFVNEWYSQCLPSK